MPSLQKSDTIQAIGNGSLLVLIKVCSPWGAFYNDRLHISFVSTLVMGSNDNALQILPGWGTEHDG